MRIVFLAVDDECAGLMQKHLYASHPEWIVGSVISTARMYRKNPVSAAAFLAMRCGFIYLGQMIKMKMIPALLNGHGTTMPTRLAGSAGVETYYTKDINTNESLAKLRSFNPDLVISTNFNQYVGKKAREIPRIGAWNLHKSLLPHYRGMAPNFYALLEGAETAGATLHVVAKGFDTGDILKQVQVPIASNDSVSALNCRTADAGGRMLAELVEGPASNDFARCPQPEGPWRTYSYPTRAHIRAFRRKGCRF